MLNSKFTCPYTALALLLLLLVLPLGCSANPQKSPENTGEAPPADCVSQDEVAKLIDPLRDPAPAGCTGCHTKEHPLASEVPDGHPNLPEDTKVTDCMQCHGNEDSSLALGKILHMGHLTSDTFVKDLKGNCSACHKLADDGSVYVKGLDQKGD